MRKTNKNPHLGIFAIVALISILLLIFSATLIDDLLFPSMPEQKVEGKTIWRGDISYYPKQDIHVFLVMGIDRSGPVTDSESHRNSGAADVVMLFVFDETKKEYKIVTLNRDSMVEMPILGLGGKHAGSTVAQLALSHTYGDGLEESCENTKTTVSDLLYGLQIDYYMAMNMDVVSILTDAVGGVMVNVKDDFSQIDSTIQMGEMILNGDQAYKFVRTRKNVADQLNLSRMDRQVEYMEGFIEAFKTNIGKDINKALNTYRDVSQYIVTDCSESIMADLLDMFYDYELVEVLSLPGENVRGEEYMEYHIDEEKLDALILDMLYSPKNK